MQLLKQDLTTQIERWDDPGDYPSNAGGGPLPSYDFVSDVEGTIELEISGSEVGNFIAGGDTSLLEEIINEDPVLKQIDLRGVNVKSLRVTSVKIEVVCEVKEFESTLDSDYQDD